MRVSAWASAEGTFIVALFTSSWCITHLHLVPGCSVSFQALKHAFQEGLCDQLIKSGHYNTNPQATGHQASYVHAGLGSMALQAPSADACFVLSMWECTCMKRSPMQHVHLRQNAVALVANGILCRRAGLIADWCHALQAWHGVQRYQQAV